MRPRGRRRRRSVDQRRSTTALRLRPAPAVSRHHHEWGSVVHRHGVVREHLAYQRGLRPHRRHMPRTSRVVTTRIAKRRAVPGYARTATIADHAAAASDIVLRRVNVTIQNHRVSKPGRSTGGSRLTSALLPCMQVHALLWCRNEAFRDEVFGNPWLCAPRCALSRRSSL